MSKDDAKSYDWIVLFIGMLLAIYATVALLSVRNYKVDISNHYLEQLNHYNCMGIEEYITDFPEFLEKRFINGTEGYNETKGSG